MFKIKKNSERTLQYLTNTSENNQPHILKDERITSSPRAIAEKFKTKMIGTERIYCRLTFINQFCMNLRREGRLCDLTLKTVAGTTWQ